MYGNIIEVTLDTYEINQTEKCIGIYWKDDLGNNGKIPLIIDTSTFYDDTDRMDQNITCMSGDKVLLMSALNVLCENIVFKE